MVFKFLTLPPFLQAKIASRMAYEDYANFKQSSSKISWVIPSSKLFLRIQEIHVNDEAIVTLRKQEFPLNDILLQNPVKLGIVNMLCSNLNQAVCERLIRLFSQSQTKIARLCVVVANCNRESLDRLLQVTGVFDLTVYMFLGEAPDFSMIGYRDLLHIIIASDVDSKIYNLQASAIRMINHTTDTEDLNRFFKEWSEGQRSISRLNLTSMKIHPNLHDQYLTGRIWNRSIFEETNLSKKISFEKLNGPNAVALFACNQRLEKIVVYIMHGRVRVEKVYSEQEAYEELTKNTYLF